jgi:hypothetical protein
MEKEIFMEKEVLEKLYAPLPVKERDGAAGKKFKYVASEAVIDRMNKVFEGNWSVEILDREVMQDQILIKARVTVRDSGNFNYSQEAYASHPLAKYTDGPKAGQIIDAGNSFRSATSKAIKAAVARWGVGLYLEEEDDPEHASRPVFSAPKNGFSGVQKPISVPPVATSAFKPVVTKPPMPTVVVPTPPVSAPAKQEPVKIAPMPVESIPAKVEEAQPKRSEFLTSVQKVAIETIVSVHKLNYSDLLVKALQRADNLPTDLGTMFYDDAVKVIQYGNNLKNR